MNPATLLPLQALSSSPDREIINAKRDRDAWRNQTRSPSSSSPRNPSISSDSGIAYTATLPRRTLSTDSYSFNGGNNMHNPWDIPPQNSQVRASATQSLPRPNAGSTFFKDLDPNASQKNKLQLFMEPEQEAELNDSDDNDFDVALVNSTSTAQKGGIAMFRTGSRNRVKPKKASSSYAQQSIPTPPRSSSRLRIPNPLTPRKDPSLQTEQIFAPDDGKVDHLDNRPWWNPLGRGIKKVGRDVQPKSPPEQSANQPSSSPNASTSTGVYRSLSLTDTGRSEAKRPAVTIGNGTSRKFFWEEDYHHIRRHWKNAKL
ncbi:hypothetical protein BCR33DRAFT_715371, partial [Rhizoclosmatium globosum]